MSYTSLWEIDKNWSGKEYTTYRNSWLFPPVVWDVLMCKYIAPKERYDGHTMHKSYLSWTFSFDKEITNQRWEMLNARINESEIQYDRVLWELAGLSVFNAKDKEFVADCIEKFFEENVKSNPEYKGADHIAERFFEVAKDIRTFPQRVKYFVIHPTSCDDNVEWWFNHKRLCSWDKYVCEFTLVEGQRIAGFATNLEICKDRRRTDDGTE